MKGFPSKCGCNMIFNETPATIQVYDSSRFVTAMRMLPLQREIASTNAIAHQLLPVPVHILYTDDRQAQGGRHIDGETVPCHSEENNAPHAPKTRRFSSDLIPRVYVRYIHVASVAFKAIPHSPCVRVILRELGRPPVGTKFPAIKMSLWTPHARTKRLWCSSIHVAVLLFPGSMSVVWWMKYSVDFYAPGAVGLN